MYRAEEACRNNVQDAAPAGLSAVDRLARQAGMQLYVHVAPQGV